LQRDYLAAHAHDRGAPDRGERDVRPGRRLPIVSDNGEKLGYVRRYAIDRSGRIVSAAPSNPYLEPADAPDRRPAA
jgi:hypothetical protein